MSDAAADIVLRTDRRLRLRGISARLANLLDNALDADALAPSDIYAIHDWVDLFGDGDRDALGLLLSALMIAFNEGSLSVQLSAESLARRLLDLHPPAELAAWAADSVALLDAGVFEPLIGSGPDDHRPIVLHHAEGRRHLYFQKYLHAELEFRHGFLDLLQRRTTESPNGDSPGSQRLQRVLDEVLIHQPLRAGSQPLQMDREQKLALAIGLIRPLSIISGGPGTGKTSIVLNLLRCLVRLGVAPDRIALAAPTGRASQRLTDSIRAGLERLAPADESPDATLRNLAATTLHRLLQYDPTRQLYRRHRQNPIAADVVVVDETSMVGVVQLAQLLQALAPGTRLILLGDKDQLPSVDAGAILSQLTEGVAEPALSAALAQTLTDAFREPVAASAESPLLVDSLMLLRTNHRSQSAIRDAAAAVNQQDVAILDRLPRFCLATAGDFLPLKEAAASGGCWWCDQPAGNSAELRRVLEAWADHAYLKPGPNGRSLRETLADPSLADISFEGPIEHPVLDEAYRLLDRTRLLTLIREGAWGVEEINKFFDQMLRPRLDRYSLQGQLFAGAPVLVTRNDMGRGLYNGDIGLTIRSRRGDLRVVFPRQGSYVSFPAESLPSHELGFAMTVHKSQGSEFDHVMIVLPPRGGRRLLTKELLYTGMTRAKSLAILVGKRESLQLAIERKILRESGLSWK
jgi:exodeoxyribonuclease V alpha subunit